MLQERNDIKTQIKDKETLIEKHTKGDTTACSREENGGQLKVKGRGKE